MNVLTERESIALASMEGKTECLAATVGKTVVEFMQGRGGSNYVAVGANVLGGLRRKGYVTYLRDLASWRITAAGRDALAPQGSAEEGK